MNTATRIIAVRHGETAWNVDTRLQGHLDIPLNANGLWQAAQVAKALAEEPVAQVYSSDLSRALDTARTIARHNLFAPESEVVVHTGLRERAFGHFEGRTFTEIETEWPDYARRWRQRDPDYVPQGGESLVQLRERVQATVHTLAQEHMGELIVLVAHGGVMDVLYRLATGQDLRAPRTWNLGNTAINRLLWTPESLTLQGWGDTRHLEETALDESST